MRADRLVYILLTMQQYGKTTARQLAEKLEVSERTVLRDMEALSAAGIPVIADRGSNGGWYLSEGYRTQLTGLNKGELQSLLVASPSAALADLGMHADYDSAFLKLLASLPPALRQDAEFTRQRLHVDGAGWHESGEACPHLPIVHSAVWEQRKLAFRYDKDEAGTERIVQPLGLVAKGSTWYAVAALPGEGGGLRSYRISRVKEARLLNETFERPGDFELSAYWAESTAAFKANLPRYPAVLRINERLLQRIRMARYAKIVRTEHADDGWLLADIEFQALDSACEYVLGLGAQIEVLEPAELRAAVIAQAKEIVALYGEQRGDLEAD